MEANSVLEVDLTALAENVRQIRGFLSTGAELCAVVKADAYGLGAMRIAPDLERLGVKWFAVYDPWQAEQILEAGVKGSVLIFMPADGIDAGPRVIEVAKTGRVHWTAHSIEQTKKLAGAAKKMGAVLPVHVEVDTGMGRGEQLAKEARELISAIGSMRELSLAGVFTHATSADADLECTRKQAQAFDELVRDLPANIIRHFANTWATLAEKRFHRGMVRVGLGLWGYPSAGTWGEAEKNGVRLRPVARWVSRIVHVKEMPSGADIGYNATFRTQRVTRLGIVPVGYADGYPLLLSDRGIVRVGKQLRVAAVLGRVNMDQLIVDLTDVPDSQIGAAAELIANDVDAENAMHKLAALAQSHPYEMLCRISGRVPRKYLG